MQNKDYLKLRNCPFCGGEAIFVSDYKDSGYVQCKKCLACTAICVGGQYVSDAYKLWNKRYEPRSPNGAYVPAGNARLKK